MSICIAWMFWLHWGIETSIWMYRHCIWTVPGRRSEYLNIWSPFPSFAGARSKYLYVFAPTQNFQDIENNISNVYLSKVLPAKTPQSLFRLFATNLHKMSPVKVAQHRRLPWQDSLCRFYILGGIRIESLTLKLSAPTLTTAQIFDAHQILIYQINSYRINK